MHAEPPQKQKDTFQCDFRAVCAQGGVNHPYIHSRLSHLLKISPHLKATPRHFKEIQGNLRDMSCIFLYSAVPRYHTYFYIRACRLTEHHLKSFSIKQSPPAGMKGGRLDVLLALL